MTDPAYRVKVLEAMIIKLARRLKGLTHDGAFNPEIKAELEEARSLFRKDKQNV